MPIAVRQGYGNGEYGLWRGATYLRGGTSGRNCDQHFPGLWRRRCHDAGICFNKKPPV